LQAVSNSRGSTPECTDQNGVDGGNGLNTGLGGGGVRVTAPPVIEKKKGLLGKKQETLSPYDVVPSIRPLVNNFDPPFSPKKTIFTDLCVDFSNLLVHST